MPPQSTSLLLVHIAARTFIQAQTNKLCMKLNISEHNPSLYKVGIFNNQSHILQVPEVPLSDRQWQNYDRTGSNENSHYQSVWELIQNSRVFQKNLWEVKVWPILPKIAKMFLASFSKVNSGIWRFQNPEFWRLKIGYSRNNIFGSPSPSMSWIIKRLLSLLHLLFSWQDSFNFFY